MTEFDYEWEKLPSPAIEYTGDRIKELLNFTKLLSTFFKGKSCMDAGCGNGRFTYAMQQMGAEVASFDISKAAIEKCKIVNPEAYVYDVMNLEPNSAFDFFLCWGVLHHLADPRAGFGKVAGQVKREGILHIMVYNRKTQQVYEHGRSIWHKLSTKERLDLCRKYIARYGGNLHGWWDAFNPKHNWSYEPKQIEEWFKEEGFQQIKLTKKRSINMRGVKNGKKRRRWLWCMHALLETNIEPIRESKQLGDIRRMRYNCERAKRILGWESKQ